MRNRVIKAEFWADEKIGSCSCVAQLLFIGSWNFADDSGVCRANIVYLRNNIFPYSSLTIKQIEEALLQLKNKKLIALGEYQGEKYLLIKNFLEHQKIDRPSKFRYINANYDEIFNLVGNTRRVIDEQSTPKEKEKGNGKEKGNEEIHIEDEEENLSSSEHNFYGEYCNVGLTPEQYGKLISLTISEKAVKELIEDLGTAIETGKEERFRADLPNLHFERLRAYWNYRRKNPQKFSKKQEIPEETPKQKDIWSLNEAYNQFDKGV